MSFQAQSAAYTSGRPLFVWLTARPQAWSGEQRGSGVECTRQVEVVPLLWDPRARPAAALGRYEVAVSSHRKAATEPIARCRGWIRIVDPLDQIPGPVLALINENSARMGGVTRGRPFPERAGDDH